MIFACCAVLGYLLGSINASIIISKLRGTDIRNYGSGNAGATNTLRTFGKGAAAINVLVDILKGVAAVLLARWISDSLTAELVAGFAAILGHNFPLYFGFRGGKGVVTSFAVALVVSPLSALIALAVGIAVIAITRLVSLGSMIGALTIVIAAFFFCDTYTIIFMAVIALLIIVRHYRNIERLVHGTEHRLGEKSKGAEK